MSAAGKLNKDQFKERKKVPVEDFNMVSHPVEAWPFKKMPFEGEPMQLSAKTPVHTVQSHVWEDTVHAKQKNALHDVGMIQHPDGSLWVHDGHHALAASRSAGQPSLEVWVHEPRGDYPARPPRLGGAD